MNNEQELPFKALGQRLKAVRVKLRESVVEVSGAVEIEAGQLERIEQGRERPSEDILQLLINHFGMRDDEADGLWQLAGYDPHCEHDHMHDMEDAAQQGRAIMVMAIDPRIVYSDQVQVNASQSGVVVSFAQKANLPQPLVASRIGMSREQALTVARTIQEALQRSEPRQLPRPKNQPKSNKKPPQHEQ
jgi:transcriptional regulator with XRE-family HTH domain